MYRPSQARGKIGYRADRPVIPAPFETDGTDRGVALCNAGAEVQLAFSRRGATSTVRIRSADRNDFLKKPRLH